MSTDNTVVLSHVWNEAGEYEVMIFVTDMFGKMKSMERILLAE